MASNLVEHVIGVGLPSPDAVDEGEELRLCSEKSSASRNCRAFESGGVLSALMVFMVQISYPFE